MSTATTKLSPLGQQVADHLSQLIEDRNIDVPMLPDVASRVLALSNDPDSDAAQLAKLIQSDQALAGHVMRIANSAAYTPNASMVSLQQAIARLGMSLISEIALAASLNSKLFRAPGFENRSARIWDHALLCGLWGKEIARLSKKNVEASFLCGLLHSIGRPAALQTIAEFVKKQGGKIAEEEVALLEDCFHVLFGDVIVRKWEMPVIVQQSVQYYRDYQAATAHKEQAMIINGAAKMASVTLGLTDESLTEVLKDQVFADLNLYDDEVEQLMLKEEQVSSAKEAMRT
ncbi:MAG: HDOD domain-containing protein [Oleiphilaceae bacterium]|nr:HDOD domain-containing protein [Oleiphilaceae bacterium]